MVERNYDPYSINLELLEPSENYEPIISKEPNMPTMPQQDRRVRFSEAQNIRLIRADFSIDRGCIWYTKKELASGICQVCGGSSTANLPQQTPCVCDKEEDESDLPQWDNEFQKTYVTAVLNRQCEHREKLGAPDPKGLFQLAKSFSKRSRQKALKNGKAHEKEVRDMLEEAKETTVQIVTDVLDIIDCDLEEL